MKQTKRMARRQCGLAGHPNYETGIRGEKAVQRSLNRQGYETWRSPCSGGPADIEAYHPLTGDRLSLQVKATSVEGKTPTISARQRERLRRHAATSGAIPVVVRVSPGRRHRFEDA